ncbi:MAG: nucleoside-diphosphate sugar epimerase/dehydratase [Bacteroidia bacterium]|nr:nucleoside-diphosphate sugar epimerase/dehydratase [Bacteroidia bacterium]
MKRFLMKVAKFIFGKSNSSSMPRYMVLVFDIVLVLLSICFVMLIKFFPEMYSAQICAYLKGSVSVVVIFSFAFIISGSYKGMVRYTGFQDIEKITKVTTAVFFILCVLKGIAEHAKSRWFPPTYFPSYTNILLTCTMVLFLTVLARLVLRRIYNEYFRPHPKIINAMIYGAGDAGIITLNAVTQDNLNQYNIVSFIDDSNSKVGKSINGIMVRKPEVAFDKKFIKSRNIETVILAMPSIDVEQRKEIIDKLLDTGLNVKSVPHVSAWVDDKNLNANQIEDIKIEDLLEREPIKLGKENVKKELEGKVVLVTGAAGSIGSEICRQVIQYNPRHIIMLDQAESPMYDLQFELNNEEPYRHIAVPKEFIVGNVKDAVKMEETFRKFKPQVIYHAAAYKHVPLMESFPYEAVLVNVFGTKNIADLAMKYGAEKFVMISTDKAVNPTNVMGATKRIAEIYTQSRNSSTKFVTTRFGNVLGSNGSVIPLFKKQLAHGGPLTVTSREIIRYFMTIPEACSLVLEAGSIGEDDDIFVFDMGKPVKIYDLARKMIKLSHVPDVQIEITGLRPGEKLYEELLATKENTIPTEHPKIMRAKVREYTEDEVNADIDTLYKTLPTCDDFKIVGQMKKIVPEFKSNNSVFQVLDTEEIKL